VDTYRKAGETTLLDLVIDEAKDSFKVLVKDIQLDPVTSEATHIGFFKVNLKEKTQVDVPVILLREESIPLIKSGEGLLLSQLTEITVECLPLDIPHQFEVDVSGLMEIGDTFTIAALKYDSSKIALVDHNPEDIIVALDYAVMEEVEEETVVTEEELIAGVDATKEKDEEADGDAGAEEAPSEGEKTAK
jgi:ribosomal protein bL25 (Ctc-form)